jgi:hypothetical protein
VFAHGIWADGSPFGKLIPTLQREGHEVIAAQYGLDTLAADVGAVKSALARDGRVWLKPEGIVCFAGDLPQEEQRLVWATHAALAAELFKQKVDGTAWRSKPSWYIVASKDRTVHPDLERFVAKRTDATVVELASIHIPMNLEPRSGSRSHP